MRKLTEAELYLLRNWSDVQRLQETTASMKEMLLSQVETALPSRRWWVASFEPPTRYESIGDVAVHKKQWVLGKGKWNHVCFGVWSLTPEFLLGDTDDPPTGYVWVESLRDRRATFNRQFKKFAKYSQTRWTSLGLEDFESDDSDYPVSLKMKRSPKQWLGLLQSGRYVEEVCKIFDRLAQFVDPIDRALAELRGSAARKKR